VANPYPGIDVITCFDKLFGRREEVAIIRSHLLARRWTVVYGQSGAGKSSIFRAGIEDGMRRERTRHTVVVIDGWSVGQSLLEAFASALCCEVVTWRAIRGLIERDYQDGCKLLLILDHFEQYLRQPPQGNVDSGFAELVENEALGVHVCAGIREDELFRIDRFRDSLTNPFRNVIAIRDLSLRGAAEAITKPLKPALRPGPKDLACVLDAFLKDGGKTVLAAILAIVCSESWKAAVAQSRRLFSNTTDVQDALANYVRNTLRALCGDATDGYRQRLDGILRALSNRGDRLALKLGQLSDQLNYDNGDLEEPLKDLVDTRLIGHDREDAYRIMHDLLLQPIRDEVWRAGAPLSLSSGAKEKELRELTEHLQEVSNRLADTGNALEFTELVLKGTHNAKQSGQARKEVVALWPLVRGLPGSEHQMRRFAASTLKPPLPPLRLQQQTPTFEIFLAQRGFEVRRIEDGVTVATFSTDNNLAVCSFTNDGKCVLARDAANLVYLWDLKDGLLLKLAGDAAMFSALMLGPEEIFRELGEGEPVRTEPPREIPRAPMTFSLGDLAAGPEVEWSST
jgi:hypothetical protein